MKRKTPDTIDELARERWILKVGSSLGGHLDKEISYLEQRGLVLERASSSNIEIVEEDKHVFISMRPPGSEKKSHVYKMFKLNNTYKFPKDNFVSYLSGFTLEKNHILFKPLKKNLQRLFEAGVMEKYPGKNMFFDYDNLMKPFDPPTDPVVLTLTHLQAGFMIWLCAVLIAILSFFGEIIFYHLTMQIKRIRGKIKILQKRKKRMKKLKHRRKRRKVEPMKHISAMMIQELERKM